MKRTSAIAVILSLTTILVTATANPHSGEMDAAGCHTSHATGEPHCHGQMQQSSDAQFVRVTVKRIADGNTVEVLQDGEGVKVRMICVDAPELSQGGWGNAAAKHLESLLPIGSAAQLRVIEQDDRFGRTFAEIYRDGQSVNLQMVRDGQAIVYRPDLDNCSDIRDQYLQTEAAAKAARRGYWQQANPIMPWDWRRGKRCNTTGPECWIH